MRPSDDSSRDILGDVPGPVSEATSVCFNIDAPARRLSPDTVENHYLRLASPRIPRAAFASAGRRGASQTATVDTQVSCAALLRVPFNKGPQGV